MEQKYIESTKVLKALADPKRLRIVDMLSCGELCACRILEEFHITQPTLSHDMKVLIEAGVVKAKPEGKWMNYSLNNDNLQVFYKQLGNIFSSTSDCICHQKSGDA
ncbi:MAG: metalloregulator ArsR/SmtB family transcription factor [Clostridiales bacterium]|jgi:ArsR family transcriptional regulator|nr:metalloregulator ArsR/SmtB family transcription factor [Clostridiales bacterium]MCI2160527.1 metalloregulator ArsR/SmtB family transcription factor [Oscillospiraceae bacterium]MCI1962321.1 metalloregulator ArsR/SmtB family transcription factor [Clostridiales bacterium]MCI2022867.1 metalloregulator ArsR/SmtB family transcription factor [Clostridiales bacterium]MCI2027264.1 metalloregulator ArsR/SmtB family transcription factor [Clostridiales bacterium]